MPSPEQIKEKIGSMRDLLARHGFNTRYLMCPNPSHDDKRAGSVSIYRAKDGDERLKCWACQFDEDVIGVAKVLGEHIDWGKPARRWRPFTATKQAAHRTRMTRQFENDPTIEKDWILAKTLARLGNLQSVQVEIQRNWDYLSENFNLPRAYELCQRIWAYGSERFGLPHGQEFKHWVERVAGELETA